MRVQQQQSWVLHTRPYRESSLLLELFTRDHGRVALVAKGVRGKKNATPPRQFVQALASWVGRGPLFTLTECELSAGLGLQGDALACGFYVNELLLRMLEPLDVHESLFATYTRTIEQLTSDRSHSATLRVFEHELLRECGYAPDFGFTWQTGEPIRADRHYQLQSERGFVEVHKSDSSVSGEQLIAISASDFTSPAVRKAARQLFASALRPHLGQKPLASRDLLRPQART